MCVCVCVCTKSLCVRTVFKHKAISLNSEFSSKTSCHTKVKEPSLPYI